MRNEPMKCRGREIYEAWSKCPDNALAVLDSGDLRCSACHEATEADLRGRRPYLFVNWKAPAGMHECFTYPSGIRVVEVGLARLTEDPSRRLNSEKRFWVGENHEFAPVLPLKASGEHDHVGWDIPTKWALDANNNCYINDAHGGAMERTTKERLLGLLCDDGGDDAHVRKMLGMKPRLPGWIATALAQGWTPPATFRREDYE